MKILILGRYGLIENGGGDKVQILNTADELRALGVEVDIKTDLNFDPNDYDLIHIFQLDWTPETFLYAKKVKKSGKPLVLSPIHHNIDEVKLFDDKFVFDYRRITRILFKDQFKRDTAKNIYRSASSFKKLYATLFSVFYGFKKMQKEVIEMSDYILVQTVKEAEDLLKTFGVDFKWKKVVNGVSKNFLSSNKITQPFDFNDYIISVGRIEPRKNQLSIIRAVKELRKELDKDLNLVFVGRVGGKKHFEYNYYFNKELKENPWIHQVSYVEYEDMPSYYCCAKVCVSASWFETTGLTSLEALYCGTNTVAAGERAKEYLGEYASYCRPDDIQSIKDAIKKEYFAPRPNVSEELKHLYTWEKAAKGTLEVYNTLVKN